MTALLDQSLARQRFAMRLLTLFAGLALALATIGIYGVMAYLVSQGTREIGIRMALGANGERAVVSMVVRQGMTMALAGRAAGRGVRPDAVHGQPAVRQYAPTDPLDVHRRVEPADCDVSRRDLFSQPPRGAHRPDYVAARRMTAPRTTAACGSAHIGQRPQNRSPRARAARSCGRSRCRMPFRCIHATGPSPRPRQ